MDNFCLPADLAGSFSNGIHSFSFAMRWGDMDMLGHLNNTVYFRAMEEARIAFINAIRPYFEAKLVI